MYPLKSHNVSLGVHVPQFGKPWPIECCLSRLCFAPQQVSDQANCDNFKYKIVIHLDPI